MNIKKIIEKTVYILIRKFRVKYYKLFYKKIVFKQNISRIYTQEIQYYIFEGIFLKGFILNYDKNKIFVDSSPILSATYKIERASFFPISILSKRRNRKYLDQEITYFLPPFIWNDNFYHFIVEILPTIVWAYKFTNFLILVPTVSKMHINIFKYYKISENRFVRFEELDYTKAKFISISNIRVSRFDKFSLPNPILIKEAYQHFVINNIPSILIISRKYSNDRKIINENILFDFLLNKYSVDILYPEIDSFESQILKLQSASIVIGSHGAGLSNIVFNRNIKLIIEICYLKQVNDSFSSLSEALGITHEYVIEKNKYCKSYYSLVPIQRKNYYLGNNSLVKIKAILDNYINK